MLKEFVTGNKFEDRKPSACGGTSWDPCQDVVCFLSMENNWNTTEHWEYLRGPEETEVDKNKKSAG